MADRNRRLGLMIVAAVVLTVAGALAVVFLWWTPRQERAEARGQVETWEKRWMSTRACLLGEPTLSADPAEALALRELSAGLVRSDTSCTDGVRKLMRPGGAMSPLDEVEHAWTTVEAAIPPLGEAYVMWISAEHDERDRYLNDLGVAISSLDAAQDELRRAAGMSALTRTGKVTLTRLDAPTPVIVDGHVVGTDRTRVQAGAITTQEFGGGVTTEIVVTAVGLGRVLKHTVEQAFSIPDGSWTATAVVDPAAPPGTSPAIVAVIGAGAPVTVVPAGGTFIPLVALGAGAERSILLEQPPLDTSSTESRLALARSTDSGATWIVDAALPVPAGGVAELRLDIVHGMVDVAIELEDEEGGHLVHLDAARPLEVVVPPTAWTDLRDLDTACRKGNALWWSSDDGVGLLDGGTFTMVAPPTGDRVIDCTASAALVEESTTPVVYHRCDARGCQEAMRGSAYTFGRAAMLDDGRVIYAANRGRMLAVWTEGNQDAQYYKLTDALMLHAIVVWYGVPYALLYDPEDLSQALLSVALK